MNHIHTEIADNGSHTSSYRAFLENTNKISISLPTCYYHSWNTIYTKKKTRWSPLHKMITVAFFLVILSRFILNGLL